MSEKQYDIVVWGATGFTGKLACEHLAKTYGLPSDACRYAIAARTQSRLDEVERAMIDTAKLHNKTNNQTSVPKILASVDDQSSIDKMVLQARVVVALAGPFTLHGEAIVKSCVANKVHYIDCGGEVEWINKMVKGYDEAAKKNNVKIVVACGIGFMPAEMAMYFASEECKAKKLTMTSVDLDVLIDGPGASGGTVRSLVEVFKNVPLSEMNSRFYAPYADCTEQPSQEVVRANECKPLSIRWNAQAQQFASFSFYSTTFSNWLRRSNELQSYVWGKDLTVRVSELSPSALKAFLKVLLAVIMSCLMVLVSRIAGVLPVPPPGKGTFDPKTVQKGMKTHIYVTVEATDQSNTQKSLTWEFFAPFEGYCLTAVSVIEGGLSLAKNPAPVVFGVLGASGALGGRFMDRLQKHNISVKQTSVSS